MKYVVEMTRFFLFSFDWFWDVFLLNLCINKFQFLLIYINNIRNYSFECPEKFDSDKCYFHGKTYGIGEILPDNYTEAQCISDCTCEKDFHKPASFDCAEECGCFDGSSTDTCIHQFDSLQHCCSDRKICGKI